MLPSKVAFLVPSSVGVATGCVIKQTYDYRAYYVRS